MVICINTRYLAIFLILFLTCVENHKIYGFAKFSRLTISNIFIF